MPFEFGAHGTVSVPGSKSLSNRVLLLAALARGRSRLLGGLESEDARLMISALSDWGIEISEKEGIWEIEGRGGEFLEGDQENFLGNAGTAMRFLSAAAGLRKGKTRLYGKERMHERPIQDLSEALAQIGVNIASEKQNGCPPIIVQGTGEIRGGTCTVSGEISSQFLSALLLISPTSTKGMEIKISGNIVSKPYLEMTLELLRQWNVEIQEISKTHFVIYPQKINPQKSFEIEADASSAAHIFSLALSARGAITISNFPKKSLQGDAQFLEILRKFGAEILPHEKGITVQHLGEIQPLGEINLENIPDAAMNAAVLAALAKGKSHISGLRTLRVKECDRIAVLEKNLKKMGARVWSGEDFLEIEGDPSILHGAKIECFDDHRIAMSFAVLGAKIPGIDILDPACTGKTFPNFWEVFEQCRK